MSRKPTSGDNTGRKKLFCLGLALIMGLLAIALSGIDQEIAEGGPATAPDIAIGIVGPMSGDMAELGRYVREAVGLQGEGGNAKGGSLGRRVRGVGEGG